MTLRTRIARLEKHRAARRVDPRRRATLEAIRSDPASVLTLAGVRPDPWQADLIRSRRDRTLALCCRQSGKSTTAAGDCVATALNEPGALVLILAPTQRQSTELLRKAVGLWKALGRPMPADRLNQQSVEFVNGSRVIALPADPAGIVGYSAPRLVVLDEAARVRDDLYLAVRPMLAVGRGRLLCCSTPFGQRGFLYEAWRSSQEWHRVKITADLCPRITPEHLDEEREVMGHRWFAQEYLLSFESSTDSVFSHDDVHAALSGWDEVPTIVAA